MAKNFHAIPVSGRMMSSAIINLFSEARYNDDDNDATMTSRYTVSTE